MAFAVQCYVILSHGRPMSEPSGQGLDMAGTKIHQGPRSGTYLFQTPMGSTNLISFGTAFDLREENYCVLMFSMPIKMIWQNEIR